MPHADALGVEDVLDVIQNIFRIEGTLKSNGEYRFLCLVHEDTHPSADCNIENGLWSCLSCHASGDLVDLGVAAMFSDPVLVAKPDQRRKRREQRERVLKAITSSTSDGMLAAAHRRIRAARKGAERVEHKNRGMKLEVPSLGSYEDGPLDSMIQRGFSEDHLHKWNVRYVPHTVLTRADGTTFSISHSIAVPIVSVLGEVLAWAYRSTDRSERWQPRWLFTPGFQTSQHWFGIDHASESATVVVVEGQADAMYLDMIGHPAVANFGTSIPTGTKLHRLLGFRKVVVFADRDQAGIQFATKLGQVLMSNGTPCLIARYPVKAKGKDPNEVGAKASRAGIERAIPYLAWARGAA